MSDQAGRTGDQADPTSDDLEVLKAAAFGRDASAADLAALGRALDGGRRAVGEPVGSPLGAPAPSRADGPTGAAPDAGDVRSARAATPGEAVSATGAGDEPVEPVGRVPLSRSRRFWAGAGAGAAAVAAAIALVVVVPGLLGHPLLVVTAATDAGAADPGAEPSSLGADPHTVFPFGGFTPSPSTGPVTRADGVGIVPEVVSAGPSRIANTWTLMATGLPGEGTAATEGDGSPVTSGDGTPLTDGASGALAVWTTTTRGGARCYMAVEKTEESDIAATRCVSGSRADAAVQLNLPSYVVTVRAPGDGRPTEIGITPAVPGPQG
ncbi:hypothetical protein BJ979_003397 [Schumannella luteola]|uniref:Uncharacterized protein n=1 Tax=Schumannella luteola TaxID=472059 RepID=A0A852YI07_9MICO|nr:hypothetical protein [Schumannella luteola]NYH00772.1 hypothetical protein [Schumannella luteola]